MFACGSLSLAAWLNLAPLGCGGDNTIGPFAGGGVAGIGASAGAGDVRGGTQNSARGGTSNSGGSSGTGAIATAGGSFVGGSGGTSSGGDSTMGGETGSAGSAGGVAGGGEASGGRAGGTSGGGTPAAGGNSAGSNSAGSGGFAGSNSGASGGASGSFSGGANGAGGSSAAGEVKLSWDFASGAEGWSGGFCDYPPSSGSEYSLGFDWAALPAELGSGSGLRLTGNNHSDDLFMYVARRVAGLQPAKQYLLDVNVEIATNAPADCGGIGGSPGLSVYVKIGASPTSAVLVVDDLGWLRLNLDKGNQAVGGTDLQLVGDISNELACPDSTYQRKQLSLSHFAVQSADDGSVEVVIGTDSGFEGVTTLYYDRISVTLRPAS